MRLEENKDFLVCDYCGNIHIPEANDDGVRVLGDGGDGSAATECPRCASPLVDASIDGQRIFYCLRCRGMLISMDIFAPLVEDLRSRRAGGTELIRPVDLKELEVQLLCPQCRGHMDTHVYGGGGNVVISDCEHCAVNWLDHGELDRIVRAPDHQVREELQNGPSSFR